MQTRTFLSASASLVLSFFLFLGLWSKGVTQEKAGLTPDNHDGFETGDWRNFRPLYIGDVDDWIRPRFRVNDNDPIHGNYSLQWTGGDKKHEWLMLSNAFYLRKPVRISVDVRVQSEQNDWSAGLLFSETKQRHAGLRVSGNQARLDAGYADDPASTQSVALESGQVYRLTVHLDQDDQLTAILQENGHTVTEFNGRTSLAPTALALRVSTGADSDAVIDFDRLTVKSASYRIRSGEWTRSPKYVVLPRRPDVKQDQGNWVGGQSVMKKDGEYLMWYRIRNNDTRGAGYGFARSDDGLNWDKHNNNPVLTYDPNTVDSAEKIDVLHVDGLYRAWYTLNTQGSWYTAYATSENGKDWEKHGLVIDETYCKDPTVIHRDGTYYLYGIHNRNKISVYTSEDGVNWERRNVTPMGMHAHVAATYVKRTGQFFLYHTGGFNGVSRAGSSDGIHFGPFRRVWEPPAVGLDDWQDAGITYLSFITDGDGQIQDDRSLPVYYQARNEWKNNIPSWLYHGGERVVLAGNYEQLYLNVPAQVRPGGGYEYETFPFEVPPADGLELHSRRPVRVVVRQWNRAKQTVGSGTIEPMAAFGYGEEDPLAGDYESGDTQVQWELNGLTPGATYELLWNGEPVTTGRADKTGALLWNTVLPEDGDSRKFEIRRTK